jgi:O-antigen ligase
VAAAGLPLYKGDEDNDAEREIDQPMTGARLTLASSAMQAANRRPRVDLWMTAVVLVAGTELGVMAAHGRAPSLIAGVVLLAALAAALVRPETLLVGWFAVILVNGRWLTFHKLGPLYVTEPLLGLLTFGVAVRLLLRASAQLELPRQRSALRFVMLLVVAMLVPALASLGLRTSAFGYATERNLLLILYPMFALITVCVTDLARSYRRWFLVAVVAPALALLLVATGHAGAETATSTGAIRIAAFTFPLAFGIAPIVLIAAARERLIRPVYAAVAAVPFLVSLVLVNHRSAWLAFIAAAVTLFGRRLSPTVIVGTVAVVVCGFILLTHPTTGTSTLGEEVARAKTVTSTSDPNARFRLSFWEAAMTRSIRSPLIGNGFDQFPANIVPPESVGVDPFPAPHNSFVAIAYRIGIIPLLLVLGLLANLIRGGFRAAKDGLDPRDRAICAALTAIVVYLGVTSAFNVFLEAPYAGPLFWTSVGLLAYAVLADPLGSRPLERTRL